MVSSLTALNIKFDNGNAVNTIYPVILKDDYETILVDCGYPGFLPLIKSAADSFHNLLRSIKTASVDVAVKDRDVYPWCGGAEIVATPGHMPGHISIYLIKSKTLIAGDALVIENGELCIANPQYTLDMERAKASIKRLLDYDIEKIVCYHGGEYTGDIKGSLRKML